MDWAQRINDMASGYKNAAILLNALRAGIFQALGEESLTAEELAESCQLDHRATEVVLLALVAAEILNQQGDRFSIDPGARPLLLKDGPETLSSILGHNLFMMRNWAYLDEALATGQPVRKEERSEQQMRDFICGMENVSRQSSRQVVQLVDLSEDRRLLDLGGGPGTAAITFAQAHSQLQCVVFDLEGPVGIAQQQIEKAGLSDRVSVVAGDFHEDGVGNGFDVVYISNIIHMLAPEATAKLLAKARQALEPGGRLILKDFFLEDNRTEPASGAQFSVNMLVNTTGGKTYTRSETLALLADAGFGSVEVIDVAVQSQLLVCQTDSTAEADTCP